MATNASVNAENAVSSASSTSEKSITISDPVKVTITVVQGNADGKSTEQASGLSSALEKIGDLVNIVQGVRSSAEQSITINDPVKVTITVVQANKDEKKAEQPLFTSVKDAIADTFNIGKLETSQSLDVDDPVTIPTKQDAPHQLASAVPLTSAGANDKPADQSGAAPDTKESATTVTAAVPAASEPVKSEETTAVTTSTEEKKESAPTVTAAVPAANEPVKSEETTTVTTSTEEKKDSATAVGSATPATEENKSTETAAARSASPTPTPEAAAKTEAAVEEKKESTPLSTSPVPTTDGTATNAQQQTTTTTSATNEEKLKTEASSPADEDSKKTDATLSSAAPPESKQDNSEDTKRQEATPSPQQSASPDSKKDDSEDTKRQEATPSPQQRASSDSTKDDSSSLLSSSAAPKESEQSNASSFPITKGNAKNLTDFQRKKAEYFFNANLDIENKKFLTWEDVEFYLLFHVTVSGKEGADGGDLEARLSRAARALWEHVFDQVPSGDGERDKLTLEQFLDTWASLIDYIVKNGQLPTLVQDLVNLGFELYSSKGTDGKASSIPVSAFEQLFQKMNLGRPYALMAYKFLTDNDTKPLDADKVNSIARAVITSSDDGHHSHFLLPGFFKNITNKPSESEARKGTPSPSPSPTQGGDQSDKSGKTTPTPQPGGARPPSPSPSSQVPQTEGASTPSRQQPSPSPSGPQQPSPSPSGPQQPVTPVNRPQPPVNPSGSPQPAAAPLSPQHQKTFIQEQDKNIRNLLRFYHIDDGDLVEVDDGPAKRLVVVHPERPLPTYIQQNPALVRQLQDSNNGLSISLPSGQQRSSNATGNQPTNKDNAPAQENKPKVTLEERVARGEAQVGPTVPARQEQQANQTVTTGIRQVFPLAGEDQRQGRPPSPSLQRSASPSSGQDESKKAPETSGNNQSTTQQQGAEKEKKPVTPEEEEQIVASILKQLTPLVEELVANEVRRVRRGLSVDSDELESLPFPFMFAGAPNSQGQSATGFRGANLGGVSGAAGFIPPELLMSMVNDFTRGAQGDDGPGFNGNGSRFPADPRGVPTGVEGFMMFGDGNPNIGGPPRPGPRY